MQKIHKLSPQLADMIAAGEVVERPGSVVKELVENAIDAGATSLTVEIQRGGMSYIRVTDNGSGMSREDAELAFLRHATSKLRDERDLEAIGTLGFRGEALAAISAVSRIELLTAEKGQLEGTSLTLEGGELIESVPAGCPPGTTIIVRDLFFNTPARLKFMKKDTAEAANVTALINRIALSHPEVAFRYIRDGKEEANTPGSGDVSATIYALLGREFSKGLMEIESTGENVSVSGFITSPSAARGNRSSQYFYVNGRYIRSQLLQTALEQGFKNSLFTGRYPGCVLYLTVKPSTVDVNVHPAKTEVRFQNERDVFNSIYYAVKSALETGDSPVRIELQTSAPQVNPEPPELPEKKPDFYRTMTAVEYLKGRVLKTPNSEYSSRTTSPPSDVSEKKEQESPEPVYTQQSLPVADTKVLVTAAEESAPPDYRIVGEAFSGYIIVQTDDELTFIDKHAAHERLIFDKLKSEDMEQMSQFLLTPVTVDMGNEDAALLLENLQLFDKLGFEIEDFGGGTVLVRRLPSDIDTGEIPVLVGELCQCLRHGGKPGSLGIRDEILSVIACKAAVKIGKNSDPLEHRSIAEHVLSGRVKYCPHGRPVTMNLSKNQLEKGFKRK